MGSYKYLRVVFLFCMVLAIWLCPTAILADDAIIEGVVFDEAYVINGQQLTLRGYGLLKYLVFYKAYVGAFYLEESQGIDRALEDTGRRLVLHYFHPITSADFAKATIKMIQKNVSPDEYKKIIPQIEQINALYRDVTPGDQYAVTYIPGVGMELALNDQSLGTVSGQAFSRAYFSIWLGNQPVSKSFRQALLGSDPPIK